MQLRATLRCNSAARHVRSPNLAISDAAPSAVERSAGSAEQLADEVTSAETLVDIENCIGPIKCSDYWRWLGEHSKEPRKSASFLVGHISSAVESRLESGGDQPGDQSVPKVPFSVLLAWLCVKGEQREIKIDEVNRQRGASALSLQEYRRES